MNQLLTLETFFRSGWKWYKLFQSISFNKQSTGMHQHGSVFSFIPQTSPLITIYWLMKIPKGRWVICQIFKLILILLTYEKVKNTELHFFHFSVLGCHVNSFQQFNLQENILFQDKISSDVDSKFSETLFNVNS